MIGLDVNFEPRPLPRLTHQVSQWPDWVVLSNQLGVGSKGRRLPGLH